MAVEDYYGLWEVVWRVRALEPEFGDDDVLALARADVLELMERGYVELYGQEELGAQIVPLAPEESERHLQEPNDWQTPQEGRKLLYVGASEKGERRYHGLEGDE